MGFVWLVVVSLYVLVACMLFYVCFLSMRWFVVVWQLFKCCVRRCCCAARVLFRLCSWQCVLLLLLRVCVVSVSAYIEFLLWVLICVAFVCFSVSRSCFVLVCLHAFVAMMCFVAVCFAVI